MATAFGNVVETEMKKIEKEKEYLGAVGGRKLDEDGKTKEIYVFDIVEVNKVNGCTELTMTMYKCNDFKAMAEKRPCWTEFYMPQGNNGKIVLNKDEMEMEPEAFKKMSMEQIMKYCGIKYLGPLSKEEDKKFREELSRNVCDDCYDYDEGDYDEDDYDDTGTVEITGKVKRVAGDDEMLVVEGKELDFDVY